MTIDLNTARAIIAGARGAGTDLSLKALSVVVLDVGAHLVALEREDGASYGRTILALGKAQGALAMGIGSRAIMARAEQQPYFVTAATTAFGGRLIPVPGGVLARDERGIVVGAVGVSGDTSDNDELAAVAGIRAAGLEADTG